MNVEMIPVCQLVWDHTAFEHEICPNPRMLQVLPKIVESIQKEGYRMNGDGVIQVSRLADKYLVITGRLQSIAAVMCKVKEVPALVYPEGTQRELYMMRWKSCTVQPKLSFEEMLDCAKFLRTKGATDKELRKAFGPYTARKIINRLEKDQPD